MAKEQVNLVWDNYADHLRVFLHELKNSNELTDVTLVCEDKKQFKAHKIILTANSPFFKDMIGEISNTNLLIYIRGVHSYEMESILEFIYLGKTTLFQDRVNEFMNVAKSLEIKGISKDVEEVQTNSIHLPEENPKSKLNLMRDEEIVQTNEKKVDSLLQFQPKGYSATQNSTLSWGIQNSHMFKKLGPKKNRMYECNQCDKQYKDRRNIYRHIKSTHLGVNYPYDECNHKAKTSDALTQHKQTVHEGVRYLCNKCGKKFTQSSNLKKHENTFCIRVKL